MDGISSTADRIAELEAEVAKLRAENENLRATRKIARVQLREQKADYVKTLEHLSNALQRATQGRLA